MNVHLQDGTVIACGVLDRKRRGKAGERGQQGKGHDNAKGRGREND